MQSVQYEWKDGVVVSGLQHSMHAKGARVSKHGMEPMMSGSNHGVNQGKFPLHIAVVTRHSTTNNFFIIKFYWNVHPDIFVVICLIHLFHFVWSISIDSLMDLYHRLVKVVSKKHSIRSGSSAKSIPVETESLRTNTFFSLERSDFSRQLSLEIVSTMTLSLPGIKWI